MILILTDESDPHADHLEQRLTERGAKFLRFDPGHFPAKARIAISYGAAGHQRSKLISGDRAVDLASVGGVWYRRPTPTQPHDEIVDATAREYITEECSTVLRDLWSLLDCFWLPAPLPAIRKAELKGLQLKVAAQLGFELPPTLITNQPEELLAFYQAHCGNIISKLSSSSLYKFTGKTFNRYTQPVSKRDVAHADGVRLCPMIFQAYVPKRVELRITVVGEQVFAAEIHSQHSNHTRHDWRRYDRYQTPYFSHALPAPVARLCVQLVRRLGLCYGAIDMVLTPDGRYVFLEINPNGQFLWIEQMTGLPISGAICDLLIAGAENGGLEIRRLRLGA
jgi:hypothetical protein